jgi:hypothetical protein
MTLADQTSTLQSDSTDLVYAARKSLTALFPDVFADGAIDFRRLRENLGEIADDGSERYG